MPIVDAPLVRFVLVGITNTVVGLSVTWIAWHVFALGDQVSNALGYLVGFMWSFALNRLWSFSAAKPGSGAGQFLRFTLVCAVAYAANLAALAAGRRLLGPTGFTPLVTAMAAYTIVNYLGSRYYVFRARTV